MNGWNRSKHLTGQKLSGIRLIAMDLDGTLVNSEKDITPRSVRALKGVSDKGIYLVPATGRAASGVPEELASLDMAVYAISANGALVSNLKTGELLIRSYLSQKDAVQIYETMLQHDTIQFVSLDGISYTTEEHRRRISEYSASAPPPKVKSHPTVDDIGTFLRVQEGGVEKISAYFKTEGERAEVWKEFKRLGYEVTSSLPLNMEVTAGNVDKGYGLKKLTEYLGLSPAQVMAFGDAHNDRAMIKYAGCGVAMGNGEPEIKACADYIAPANDEDGLAKTLEELIL